MAQNYSELRKDNARDAIYEDAQNNFEVLRTSWSGESFPENPKVGQPCYRTDEDKLYYWDGFKWSQKGGGGSAELKSMELPAIETERVSIVLEGARCLDKNMMFVFVDKIAQDPSSYSMNDDGTVVNFNPAIPANAAVTLRWFDTDVGTFDTAIFASDAEFTAGTATNRAPNVKQVRSGMMTLDTVQTVSAAKVFTAEQQRKSTEIDITTTAESYMANNAVGFQDKNGRDMGHVENAVSSSGIHASVMAKNKDNYQASVGVVVPQSGTSGAYGIAPSTPIDAPSNAVVTKGYMETAIESNPSLQAPFDRVVSIENGIVCGVDSEIAYVAAGSAVYFPDGKNEETNTYKYGSATVSSKLTIGRPSGASDGDKYYICAQLDENKSVTGLIAIPVGNTATVSTSTSQSLYVHRTNTNFIDRGSATSYSQYSVPLMLVSVIGSGSHAFKLLEVFDTYSFFGTSIFKLPNVKYAFANGVDETTKKPVSDIVESEMVVEDLSSSQNSTAEDYECLLFVRPAGYSTILKPEMFYTGVSEPYNATKQSIWFDEINKVYKSNYTSTSKWETFQTYNWGRITTALNSSTNTYYFSDLKSHRDALIGAKTTPTVVETYHSGTSWYRVWSDGFIEQAGVTGNFASPATITVNLLVPFSKTSYHVSLTADLETTKANDVLITPVLQTRNLTNFVCGFGSYSGRATSDSLYWYACGY